MTGMERVNNTGDGELDSPIAPRLTFKGSMVSTLELLLLR